MANKIRGITIELSADASGVLDAVSEVNKKLKTTSTDLKDVDKLLKFDPTNTTLLTQKTQLLQTQISNCKEKLEALKTAQADMKANGVDENSEQYQALQREIAATEQELKTLEQTTGSGSAALAQISAVTGEWGEKLTDTGKKLSVVSAGIVAFGTAAVKAFNDVDEGADIVIKKTGATGEEAAALQEAYTNVAQTIVADFEDIGTAVGEVSTRFGLTGTALEELSTTFLKFADINDLDVETAIRGVDMALKTFNLDQSEATNVMGLLTSTAQSTGISMDELLSNLQQYGPTLKEMGLGLDDAVYLMGSFEEAGIDSSDMLSKLQKAAAYYNEQGLSMEEGLSDLIARLQDSSTEADATAEAYEIFGKKGGLAFVTAAKEGKISIGDLEDSMDDYATVVDDTYQATLDGTDAMALAWQNTKLALAELGSAIAETLAPIMESLTETIKSVTDWFGSLDDSTQNTIVTIGLIVAAIGPLLVIIGKVMTAISGITSALSKIGGTTFGPIGLVIAGVAALVLGLTALFDSWKNAALESSPFKEALDEIKEKNDALAQSLSSIKKTYEDSVTGIEANGFAAKALYDRLVELMDAYDGTDGKQKEIQSTIDSLNQAVPELGLSWDGVTNSLNLTNDEILANIEALTAQAKAMALQDMYVESLKAQYEAQKNLEAATTTMNDVLGAYGLTMQDVSLYMESGGQNAAALNTKISAAGLTFYSFAAILEECITAVNGYNDASDNATEAAEDVTFAENELANAMAAAAGETKDAADSMSDDMVDAMDEVVGAVDDAAENVKGSTEDLTDNIVNKLSEGKPEIESEADGIKQAVSGKWDEAALEATRYGTVLTSNLSGSMLSGKKDVVDAVDSVEGGMESAIDPVTDAMTEAGDDSASNLDSSFGAWAATVEQTVTKMYNLFQRILGHSLVNDSTIWGTKIGTNFNTGFGTALTRIALILQILQQSLSSSFGSLSNTMYQYGSWAGQGFYNGLSSWAYAISNQAWSIANSVNNAARSALRISSPSKVMEQLGEYTGEGFAIGLEKSTEGIFDAMSVATNAAQTATMAGTADTSSKTAELNMMLSLLTQYLPYLAEQTDIVLDDGTLAGHMAPKMNVALQGLATRASRG